MKNIYDKKNYKKIAIITARSGSKGLPDKNILLLGNKPLMAYTIEAAVKSKIFDRIIVSTDSYEYKEISEKYGAEVIIRSKENSSDIATSYQVIEEVMTKIDNYYDYFVLLQPTSPFRNENHILEAVKKFEKKIDKFDFLVSVVKSGKSSGLFVEIDEDESLKNMKNDFSNYRRQNYSEYHPNGAIYIGKKEKYLKNKHFYGEKSLTYIMNKEDSIDIDDALDFELAISILNKKNKENLLKNKILKRIEIKKNKFNEVKDITLIGNSIMYYFPYDKINEKDVNNLGIKEIKTEQYIKYIIDRNLIKNIGNNVIIMLGIDDLLDEKITKEKLLKNIKYIIEKIKFINKKTNIFFIEINKVGNRIDRKNNTIDEVNNYFYNNLKNEINYIKINDKISNVYGKLDEKYTDDGINFNKEGYKIILNLIIKKIKKEKKC